VAFPTGLQRRRAVELLAFDAACARWTPVDRGGGADRDEVTLATYNIWFDDHFATERFGAIADLLAAKRPDVMVFQEVTPEAVELFLGQQWIREAYLSAAVVGGAVGNYGMLMLSRLPIGEVTYARLPSRTGRGCLQATLTVSGRTIEACSVHLDSGRKSWWRRAWQLRAVFRALRDAENVVVLGDFNMRDDENRRIPAAYCDVWPAIRPDNDGFTEDTSINAMRYDMKNKSRQVRFDRVLLKGNGWTPTDIELLGTEPVSDKHPRVFPSDHFGVFCRIRRAGFSGPADERLPTPHAAR
jgi:endonuclease/exonuclease/phosphatase family metal-dependent hydrolase